MYTQVAERWLADQPRMEQVQREFLEKARAVYEELADDRDVDSIVRREACMRTAGSATSIPSSAGSIPRNETIDRRWPSPRICQAERTPIRTSAANKRTPSSTWPSS